jgi:glycine oxidase
VHIIVVGAGIVGLSVAYELASRGARVTVVDHRGIGQGATRASAGILAPYIEGHGQSLLQLGVASFRLYEDFVARVQNDSGQQVELDRTGTLQVALSEHEADHLVSIARGLAAADVPHRLVDGSGVRELEPSVADRAVNALFVPDHGYVAAAALTLALFEAARRHGMTLVGSRGLALERTGDGGARLRTSGEVLAGDAIVLAAGSWSSDLEPATAVKPIRGQLLHLRLGERPASRVLWGGRCYIVPWRDGSVLVGATVEDVGFDERATARGVQQLLDAATELVPLLAGATFEEVRVGLRPLMRDELPAIGPSSTLRNVIYATGHYRNGVLLAPLTAALIADLILEQREGPELALVHPARVGL